MLIWGNYKVSVGARQSSSLIVVCANIGTEQRRRTTNSQAPTQRAIKRPATNAAFIAVHLLSSRATTMSYQIVAISNERGAPEQAYNKLEKAAAGSNANYAGEEYCLDVDR